MGLDERAQPLEDRPHQHCPGAWAPRPPRRGPRRPGPAPTPPTRTLGPQPPRPSVSCPRATAKRGCPPAPRALKPWTSAGQPCRAGLAGGCFCPGISADTCSKLVVNKAPHSSHGRWPGSVLRTPGDHDPMSPPQKETRELGRCWSLEARGRELQAQDAFLLTLFLLCGGRTRAPPQS